MDYLEYEYNRKAAVEKAVNEEPQEKKGVLPRLLILFIIVVVFASLFIPVFQSAQRSKLEYQKAQLEREYVILEEDYRMLRADIARMRMPEGVIENSVKYDVAFSQIDQNSLNVIKPEMMI